MYPDGTEIQSYFDNERKAIWISSNRTPTNKKIHETLVEGEGLENSLSADPKIGRSTRESRHRQKLVNKLSKPFSPGGDVTNEIVMAIKKRRIKIPVKYFTDGGES